MKVKAQGLLNAAKYIEETYGREALGKILRAASPGVRETYTSAIAINWHPLDELCEFAELADVQLGTGNGALPEAIGAAGARANLKGVLNRFAFYVAKPEFLMTRVASMWSQFNDEGTMVVVEIIPDHAVLEVKGVKEPRATFCSILTGWAAEVSRGMGATSVVAKHIHCRARGGTRCVWEINAKTG
jgi:predicted hydrocarbon binding protein